MNRKAASQKMGKLPEEKTIRSDPFTHVSLDIMAPVSVIQTVKSRTQRPDHREVVLAALSQTGGALKFASPDLRADRSVVQMVRPTSGTSLTHHNLMTRGDWRQCEPQKRWIDRV